MTHENWAEEDEKRMENIMQRGPTGEHYDAIGRDDQHTTKHNRDVELTDLLAHLLDRYGDWMTPQDRERIDGLTKPL